MQIDKNTFMVNSLYSLAAFSKTVSDLFAEHKFVTFTWRIGEDRSLDQNSLFHVWLTEYAAHLGGIHKKAVTPGMIEFLKRKCKKAYYNHSGQSFMLTKLVDPLTGEEGETIYASSKDYKRGEMFLFLTWLQNHAAEDGCILESRGEYMKLQREAA
jgi:hypothetical protein